MAATVVPNIKNAMKLKNAAQTTACLGDKTLVETTVEMELAASCMPLVKSKTRAKAMTKIGKAKLKSTVCPSTPNQCFCQALGATGRTFSLGS
jgi:hypothetical protein